MYIDIIKKMQYDTHKRMHSWTTIHLHANTFICYQVILDESHIGQHICVCMACKLDKINHGHAQLWTLQIGYCWRGGLQCHTQFGISVRSTKICLLWNSLLLNRKHEVHSMNRSIHTSSMKGHLRSLCLWSWSFCIRHATAQSITWAGMSAAMVDWDTLESQSMHQIVTLKHKINCDRMSLRHDNTSLKALPVSVRSLAPAKQTHTAQPSHTYHLDWISLWSTLFHVIKPQLQCLL